MKLGVDTAASRILVSTAKSCRLRYALALGVAALVAYPFAGLAQVVAPSQVTPQSLRPAAPSASGGLQVSDGAGLQAPAGAEGLNVIVGRLTIEGAFPELDSETRTFAKAVEGQRVTVARIYELANALEQAYARAGYVLARVTVPPQKLNDNGPLLIVVVDGFVERVQVDNVPDRVRLLITNRMASLVGRRHVKLEEIERRLLISADVPGLRLKSTLARGETTGGALLVLEGTHQLVTATATVDNHLPSVLGTWSYGGTAAFNSPFGFGEQFYASAQSAGELARTFDPQSPLRVLGAGAVLPLGFDGWIVNPEYTYSRSVPVPVSGGLDNIGHFQRVSLRTSYPLIRTRTQTLTLTGTYEYITQSVNLPLFTTDLNRDRYGVMRAGAALESPLPWLSETLQASTIVSHGTGGRDAVDAAASGIPLSRQGAGPLFTKATVDAHVIQPLPEAFRFDLIGRAQTSFGEPMLVSEQFFLDGPQAVSAYPASSLSVDEGGTLRGELNRPFTLPGSVPLTLSPYGFGVLGAGRLVDPTVVEVAMVRAASFGAGLRGNIDMPGGYQGVSLGLEAARQYSNLPNLAQSWRINVATNIRF
jgi:hemolysin activation/secretion protein